MASEEHESPVLNQEANKKPFQKDVPNMDLQGDTGIEASSKDLENQMNNLKQSTIMAKADPKHVDLLVKEFDLDKYTATNILRKNKHDLKQSILYCLNN